METPQILHRDFKGLSIRQNHKTTMFSANDLLDAYRIGHPLTRKSVAQFMDNASAKEFIEVLIQQEHIPANLIYNTTRGRNGTTWMHPYLFLDFAMWLSPEFKLAAIKWIYDNLCSLRDASGDEFKELNATIKDVLNPEKPYIYSNECRMIQGIAGVDIGGRNLSDIDKLTRLNKLQEADIKLLHSGVVDYHERKKRLITYAEMI